MTRTQAEEQARAWLIDRHLIDVDTKEPHTGDLQTLTRLLLSTQAAVLEEAAKGAEEIGKGFYTYAQSKVRHDMIQWLQQQAEARRGHD